MKIAVQGIRPSWAETGDQKRFMTPREAIQAGAGLYRHRAAHHRACAAARGFVKISEELPNLMFIDAK